MSKITNGKIRGWENERWVESRKGEEGERIVSKVWRNISQTQLPITKKWRATATRGEEGWPTTHIHVIKGWREGGRVGGRVRQRERERDKKFCSTYKQTSLWRKIRNIKLDWSIRQNPSVTVRWHQRLRNKLLLHNEYGFLSTLSRG